MVLISLFSMIIIWTINHNYIIPSFINFNKFSLISGLFLGSGLYLLSKSVSISPNSGFSLAIFRTSIIYTTIFSHILLNSKFNLKILFFIILTCIGTILFVKSKNNNKIVKELNRKINNHKIKKPKHKINFSKNNWIIFAIFGAILDSIFVIMSKKALLINNNNTTQQVILQTFGITLSLFFIFIINNLIIKKFTKIKDNLNKPKKTDYKLLNFFIKYPYTSFIFSTICFCLTIIFFNKAIIIPSNPGFVKTIMVLSVPIAFAFSKLIRKVYKLDVSQIIGLIILICGSSGISLS